MQYLKQSTATTIPMGPFLDSTDGNSQETGLTIAQADIRLTKNGGAYAQTHNAAGATHMEAAKYGVPLDTTDTATLGRLRVDIHVAGALAVWDEYMVVTANFYDSLFSTDKLQVDVTQIGGVAQSATDLKDFADAGYDPATNKVQGVVLTDTCTTNTDMRGTDSAATATNLATVDTVVDGIQTDLSNATDGLGALKALVDANQVDLNTILADTNELQTDWVNGGRLDLILDIIAADVINLDGDAMRGTDSAATATNLATVDTVVDGIQTDLSNATDGLGALKAMIDAVDTVVDAILVDTSTTLQDDLTFIRDEAGGKWQIINNQMIFYKEDASELMRFNLFDVAGAPAMTDVYKRERV